MKSALLMMAVAAGVFGLSGAASAQIVTATFTGTVNFVYDPDAAYPPASAGDTLIATYVFDLAQSTSSSITPTGGFVGGPYGSFASASVTVDGVAAVLPTFLTGQLTGETQVFDTGSVIDADLFGTGTSLDSNITGMDFAYNLTMPATGFSYTPTAADQTLIQLSNNSGDLLEADISQVTLDVSSPGTSPTVPEPSTWALMLLGFAGMGCVLRRASRTTTTTST